jgi:hypothetical protein
MPNTRRSIKVKKEKRKGSVPNVYADYSGAALILARASPTVIPWLVLRFHVSSDDTCVSTTPLLASNRF